MSQYSQSSRNGKLRMDSDGKSVTLTVYPTDGFSAVLASGSITVAISDLEQVIGRVFEVAERKLSDADLDDIAERVCRRAIEKLRLSQGGRS